MNFKGKCSNRLKWLQSKLWRGALLHSTLSPPNYLIWIFQSQATLPNAIYYDLQQAKDYRVNPTPACTAPPRFEFVVNVIPAETSDALPVTTTTTDGRTLELPPRDSIVSGTHNES